SVTSTKADTTTTVVSSVNPSVSGQSVTFTATVTSSVTTSANPTGTVTFYDNGVSIGTGTTSTAAVTTATFTTNTLAVRTHTMTAIYDGDTNFNSSPASPAVTQTVDKADI